MIILKKLHKNKFPDTYLLHGVSKYLEIYSCAVTLK